MKELKETSKLVYYTCDFVQIAQYVCEYLLLVCMDETVTTLYSEHSVYSGTYSETVFLFGNYSLKSLRIHYKLFLVSAFNILALQEKKLY